MTSSCTHRCRLGAMSLVLVTPWWSFLLPSAFLINAAHRQYPPWPPSLRFLRKFHNWGVVEIQLLRHQAVLRVPENCFADVSLVGDELCPAPSCDSLQRVEFAQVLTSPSTGPSQGGPWAPRRRREVSAVAWASLWMQRTVTIRTFCV